jgi:hypothetical protein
MAQKKITDLQLRSNVTADVNFPSDDGIQSYRVTANQIKSFVLPDAGLELEKLAASIVSRLVPVGSVLAYAGNAAPSGFLLCDGSEVSRSTYEDLFDVIGTTHGQGDNSTTFNVPDYRGRFLRGVDGTANRDPDKASREVMNTGGNTGNNVGSVQGDTFQGHFHDDGRSLRIYAGSISGGATMIGETTGFGSAIEIEGNAKTNGTNGTPRTSNETRPINANVNYIIKV